MSESLTSQWKVTKQAVRGKGVVVAQNGRAAQAGAEILHPARVWPEYHPGYYGVFLRDPDGNNVEAVHHSW